MSVTKEEASRCLAQHLPIRQKLISTAVPLLFIVSFAIESVVAAQSQTESIPHTREFKSKEHAAHEKKAMAESDEILTKGQEEIRQFKKDLVPEHSHNARKAAAATNKAVTNVALKSFRDPYKTGVGSGPEMIWIPAGKFNMGSKEGLTNDNETPLRKDVRVGSFGIGKTEVTVGEYLECVNEGACREPVWREKGSLYHYQTGIVDWYRKQGPALTAEDSPIVGISWENGQEYVKWLSQKTGQEYRLPNPEEWEYACRAGKETTYCGSADVNKVAWTNINSGQKIHRVASLSNGANAFGLYDMSGNAMEFVEDCLHDSYQSPPQEAEMSTNKICDSHSARGGSWGFHEAQARTTSLYYVDARSRYDFLGFRVARTK